jgi:hypothetical protein
MSVQPKIRAGGEIDELEAIFQGEAVVAGDPNRQIDQVMLSGLVPGRIA